jgi:hypothetical protein
VRVRDKGRTVIVTGRATGVTAVTAKATRRGHRVARAKVRLSAGRFTARLRVGHAGVRVTVTAGTAKRTLSVR